MKRKMFSSSPSCEGCEFALLGCVTAPLPAACDRVLAMAGKVEKIAKVFDAEGDLFALDL